MRRWLVWLTASAILGCATDAGPVAGPDERPAGEPGDVRCWEFVVDIDALPDAPRFADVTDHPGSTALRFEAATMDVGAELDDPSWRVIEATDVSLALLRELDEPDTDATSVRTHEVLAVAPIDEDDWMLAVAGTCALQVDLGDLLPAVVLLDPEQDLDPASERIELLVVEQACASGRDAEGRVEVEVEVADVVGLTVGVRPLEGDQNCPGNPATPVTIELDEPIGDRTIVDAGRYPPLEVPFVPDDFLVTR